MATNRISVLVALEGSDDGLERALNSAPQSLGDLAANAKPAGEKAAAGRAVLGRPIVINNRGGASGTIGVAALVHSVPDGDTLGFVTSIPITLQPHLIRGITFGPTDQTPICHLTNAPTSLIASSRSGIDNVAQLVERARAVSRAS